MRTTLGMAVVLSMVSFPVILSAQTARQATPAELGQPELQEIPSPMLLEISLGSKENAKPLSDPSVKGRTYYDTKKYVCDKAQVTKVTVIKKDNKRGGIDLEVTPLLKTEYPRQDIDFRVALIGADNKEIQFKTWEDLTIGADDSRANKLTALTPFAAFGGSSSKMPEAVFSFGKGEFENLFQGEAPKVRLIVKIKD